MSKSIHQPVQYFMDKAQRKLPQLNKSKLDELVDNLLVRQNKLHQSNSN